MYVCTVHYIVHSSKGTYVYTKTIQFHTQTMYMVRSNINTGQGAQVTFF